MEVAELHTTLHGSNLCCHFKKYRCLVNIKVLFVNPSSDFKRLVVWGVELYGNNMVAMVADDGEASRGAFICPINI